MLLLFPIVDDHYYSVIENNNNDIVNGVGLLHKQPKLTLL